jgi:hypothetical protein
MRIEGQNDMRFHIEHHVANSRFDFEHVYVRQRAGVVVALTLLPSRIMKPEQHRRLDAEPRARNAEFLDAQRGQVGNGANRWVRLAGLPIRRAGERDANATLGHVRQDAAMKDLVIGMRENRKQGRAPVRRHDDASSRTASLDARELDGRRIGDWTVLVPQGRQRQRIYRRFCSGKRCTLRPPWPPDSLRPPGRVVSMSPVSS